MNILAYTMEEILDPTNILEGQRYEFLLDLETDEEDELFENGSVDLRVIVAKNEESITIADYFFMQTADKKILDFGLEEEEEQEVLTFVKQHVSAGE